MTDELPYRIALAGLFALFVLHRAFFLRKRPRLVPRPDATSGDPLRRLPGALLGVLAVTSVLAYLARPALISWAGLSLPPLLRWAGVGMGLAGLWLLDSSQRALGGNWTFAPGLVERHELIRRGPYARIRHPLYAALLLVQGSSLLITSNWALGLFCLSSTFLDVLGKTRKEEELLLEHFGPKYSAYMSVTGRFLPRLRRPGPELS